MVTSFFSEILLFCFLPISLCLPFMFNSQDQNGTVRYNDATRRKKYFFLLLRFAQILIVLSLAIDVFITYPSAGTSESLFNIVLLHAGNFFFRHDFLVWFVNFFLTALTLFYLYLVAFVFSRTNTNISYITELPFLIICTLLALRLFIATNDLTLMVILLEITAFCSVIYIGVQSLSAPTFSLPIEAAIKYFIINAIAVALLLFAISLYFYLTGSNNLIDVSTFFYRYPHTSIFFMEQIILTQFLFFFAYLIKLGASPMHQWVPDVYEGAETLVTTFLVLLISPALVFKFLMLFKIFLTIPTTSILVTKLMLVCGCLSIIFGTFGAFYQTRIKRFIAYAGLTHLGFMLLGLGFNTFLSYYAFLFYLLIYVLTNLCFFSFLLLCQYYADSLLRLVFINQLKFQIQNSFFLFLCLLICLFSFAGIPPFAGFFAKFFVLALLIQQKQYFMFFFLIVAILIGTFMYLRFLKISLFETDPVLEQTPWYQTLKSVFFVLPTTLVTVVTDLQFKVKLQNVLYKKKILDCWQQWILSSLTGLLSFLTFFIFFFAVYNGIVFDLSLTVLTLY